MKTNMKIMTFATILLGCTLLLSFTVPQDKTSKPWDIPAEYMKMKSDIDPTDASLLKVGKMLYSKHCKSCHGNMGLGDGPKAKQLETFAGDFSTETFHGQSDGELYYKSFVGRDEMPNYEKKITDDEDRWALIAFMRATFKK